MSCARLVDRAWDLHPPSQVGTRDRAALLRTPPLSGYPRASNAPPRRLFAFANDGDDPLGWERAMGIPPAAGYPTRGLGVVQLVGARWGLSLWHSPEQEVKEAAAN